MNGNERVSEVNSTCLQKREKSPEEKANGRLTFANTESAENWPQPSQIARGYPMVWPGINRRL